MPQVMQATETLDRCYPLADGRAVFVRALGIGVGARPRTPSDEIRGRLIAAMTRTYFTQRDIWLHKDDRPRFSFPCKATFISPAPHAAESRDNWWSVPTM